MKKFNNDLYETKLKENLEKLISIFGNGEVQGFIDNINDGEYDAEDIKLVKNRIEDFRSGKVNSMGASNLLRLIYMLKKKNISADYLFFGEIDSLSEELKKELDLLDRLRNVDIYVSAKKYLFENDELDFICSQADYTVEGIAIEAVKFAITEIFSANSIKTDIYEAFELNEEYTLLYLIKLFVENTILNETEKKTVEKLISMIEEKQDFSFIKNPEDYKLAMLKYIIKDTEAPAKQGDENSLEYKKKKYTITSMAEEMDKILNVGEGRERMYREKLDKKLNKKIELTDDECYLILALTKTKKEYLTYKEYPEDAKHLLLQLGLVSKNYKHKENEIFSCLKEFIDNLTIDNLVLFYNVICNHYKSV